MCEDEDKAPDRGAWIICPVCDGDGHHVNPNIDGNGLTRDDFDDDPDFAEGYMRGDYDVQCVTCQGMGKVRERTEDGTDVMEALRQHAADRELAYREDGVYDPGYNPHDYRYG